MKRPHFRHRSESIPFRIGQLTLSKRGISRFDWRNPYHTAVSAPGPVLFAFIMLVQLLIHLSFATLYWLARGSVANATSFVDDFFFSIETLSTVGYGVFAPSTVYGHILSSIEIYFGLGQTAIITGLIFVRFSRPKGRLLFADSLVITQVDGVPNLMLRLGNGGLTTLVDAEASLTLIMLHSTKKTSAMRELYDLPLVRTRLPLFPLVWVLRHPIDEKSSLHGLTAADLEASDTRIFATCSAYDQGLGAQIHGTRNYIWKDIVFGARYADLIMFDEKGSADADYSRLHMVEQDIDGAQNPEF